MASRTSAGILLYRFRGGVPEVFLVHPGGPYWTNKDEGAWSIPKGEFDDGDDALAAARREFEEETGQRIDGDFVALTPQKQKSGKVVHAWAVEGDVDAAAIVSNTFTVEWPPRSGKRQAFPEVDRAAWLELGAARAKILAGQRGFLDELKQQLRSR